MTWSAVKPGPQVSSGAGTGSLAARAGCFLRLHGTPWVVGQIAVSSAAKLSSSLHDLKSLVFVLEAAYTAVL